MLLAGCCFAGVTRIEVKERTDVLGGRAFGTVGPYERIAATAHFAIDPKLPANRIISDVDLAPRNPDGLIEFSADLYVLRPRDPSKGNGIVLYEVSNRGGRGMLRMFNLGTSLVDAATREQFGDGFLLDQGFTLVWLGWQADLPQTEGRLRLYAPRAQGVTGLLRAEFVVDELVYTHSLADRNHIPYPVLDLKDPSLRLTVRDSVEGARQEVPRGAWDFADSGTLRAKNGFEPGRIYELVYRSKDPILVGLGPAGARDLISFFKYGGPNTLLADQRRYTKQAMGFGSSQSGRFLRTFLYYGFNRDEKNRKVFDGVWAHVAGGGRGSFNHRFAQPSRDGHPFMNTLYPTDIFPFSDLNQTDPVTGVTGGILRKAQEQGVVPKIFYTNSSYEYWGRAASLIHTNLEGTRDAELAPGTRIYLLAGTQHGSGSFPPAKSRTQNTANPADYRPLMRALLLCFQGWLKDGVEPPASEYPLIAKGQLVPLDKIRFPKLAGVKVPKHIQQAYRADYGEEFRSAGIVTKEPPAINGKYTVLVPQVDESGNDISGVRLPEITVPVATYTGWNLRDPKIGAGDEIYSMVGSFLPFARTKAAREQTHDPRLSMEERYNGRDEYLRRVKAAAGDLVKKRLLLERDVPMLMERAQSLFDFMSK